MVSFQFIIYNITVSLIIAHFFDSAKDHEWNEVIYFGNYPFWLISSTWICAFLIAGIIPVYHQTNLCTSFCIITWVAGLLAGGYHLPMNHFGKSEVCNNSFSYWLMAILSTACIILISTAFSKKK